jgi:hypothetical protein
MLRTIVSVILLLPFHLAMAYSYTVEITEQALQQRVSAMMPMQKQLLFFSVLISEPKVDLVKGSNRIGIMANIAAVAPDGSKGSGKISLTGDLDYAAGSGSFYLHNPVIETIKVNNVPEQFAPDIKQVAQIILSNAMLNTPVYTLQDNDLRQKHLKSMLESVTIENEKLVIVLSTF